MRETAWLALFLALPAVPQERLPGTAALQISGDPAAEMVDGIHRALDRMTAEAPRGRQRFWHRDYSSREAYERSVAPNRERLRRIIGAVDERAPVTALQYLASTAEPSLVFASPAYRVHAVRWPVFEDMAAEGLLLEPSGPPVARVVVLPDADQTPEMLAGLAPGAPPPAQWARQLAESGCQVLVPVLIDRQDTWSGIPGIKMTNQPHREWIWRMAFEAGRHIIGYEVQEALAAVDWFEGENAKRRVPVAVAGYGEGGMLALYAAALDPRIAATLVSGYFGPRERVWTEPVYRDVWGLLREFGDAEIASLIAPRALVIEAGRGPRIEGPPPATKERTGATPNGTLAPIQPGDAEREVERARAYFTRLGAGEHLRLESDPQAAVNAFSKAMGAAGTIQAAGPVPRDRRRSFDPAVRQHREFIGMVDHTQAVLRAAPARRAAFWSKADSSTPERWTESSRYYRDYIWNEMIGRMPDPSAPANPHSRLIYDTPKFRGYEVMLDVWPDVFAYGILLVPKDLRPGERRPVVVCQHGLEGRPSETADPASDSHYYHRFAARLAGEGFITYSPQNPYIGLDRFRLIQRKAHPLQLSLFSFILGQHQRTLEWLRSLPFVDGSRIGFYGLSYGGKTAVRVPPLLDGYALSICSADYNEWVWKTTSIESKYSYLLTGEYDMYEFDFANVVNYAELAELMAPRPFMVERGHADGVAPDEWVAYEFAPVRRFYDTRMHLPERARIEFFDGPHTIHGVGTFEFLRRFLDWPGSK